jgi:hypothetical protein
MSVPDALTFVLSIETDKYSRAHRVKLAPGKPQTIFQIVKHSFIKLKIICYENL